MREVLNNNNNKTEIVGVNDTLKSFYSTQADDSNCDFSIMDNKITINPSSSIDESEKCDNGKIMINNDDIIQDTCGWYTFRPKCLQRFMNPKWTLLFLCIAGAVQGISCEKKIISNIFKNVLSKYSFTTSASKNLLKITLRSQKKCNPSMKLVHRVETRCGYIHTVPSEVS